jgi:hypothetical protein
VKRIAVFFSFALLLIISAAAFAASAPGIREIKSPTFSQPAFAFPGGTVPVQFKAAAGGKATSASFEPSFGGEPVNVALDAALLNGGNNFVIQLPPAISPQLYDLCIVYTTADTEGTSRDCQRHAVLVAKSFDPPFTFVQISDYHKGDPRADRQFPGVDIERVRMAALNAANREKPAFILVTGDVNSYPDTFDVDYPASSGELVDHASAPLIILPGNHDFYSFSNDKGKYLFDGKEYWAKFYGPERRAFDYGPFRFICFNSYDLPIDARNENAAYSIMSRKPHTVQGGLTAENFKWIFDQVATAGGRTLVFAAHHDPRNFESDPSKWCKDCVTPKKFTDAIRDAGVAYYFYGHIHNFEEYVDGPTHYFSSTSVGSDVHNKELWAILVINVKSDRTLEPHVVKLFDAPPMKAASGK